MPEIDQTDNYPELFNSPALHISNVVSGRENINGREYYNKLTDAHLIIDERKAIPEEVVLYRWRRREFNNLSFKGFRLSPNIWRSVGKALGDDAKLILQLEKHSIKNDLMTPAQP